MIKLGSGGFLAFHSKHLAIVRWSLVAIEIEIGISAGDYTHDK